MNIQVKNQEQQKESVADCRTASETGAGDCAAQMKGWV